MTSPRNKYTPSTGATNDQLGWATSGKPSLEGAHITMWELDTFSGALQTVFNTLKGTSLSKLADNGKEH